MKTSAEVRQMFLDYFQEREHQVVSSATLIPDNDPTLLFTNAGMVPFKDIFLSREKRDYMRAASAQRCVRAGGKHNDLENVGYTARHHTFFEMLGNFSFGDYFKRDAIYYAWEFLTEIAGLPVERLWVTVHQDDDEAANIWLDDVGVDAARFVRIGNHSGGNGQSFESDNFWSMGDTGPCGPCSEIFYDHGPDIAGGPPGSSGANGDRYVEIWNLVFMQYNRDEDGYMHALPKPSVDTGMGLERLVAVLQGVHGNYEIDLFVNLIQAAADVLGIRNEQQISLRVIADHIRSCSFLIADGIQPSNDGRGYVLRRIIRRAIRHGNQLGAKESFFHRLVAPLCKEMGGAYPELLASQAQIEQALKQEEVRFAETLHQGMKILDLEIKDMSGADISGETVFRLYDTYGFPVDLTADIARERGLGMDMAGFEACMSEQRGRARAAGAFQSDYYSQGLDPALVSNFSGYDCLEDSSRVLALIHNGQAVDQLLHHQEGSVILEHSPFYAESGGQVGDRGTIAADSALFHVMDTQKQGRAIVHIGRLQEGMISIGDIVKSHVNVESRQSTALNHSATHLLHAALRHVLGTHVTQKGSLVEVQRLRFDFSHPNPVSHGELELIERLVNQEIRSNHKVTTRLMKQDEAMALGAMALFGEKYDDEVRVLSMGDFSVELCGGTHVKRSGDIGLFKITLETGIAAGVRRIEAVTGQAALDCLVQMEHDLKAVSTLIKGSRKDIVSGVRFMAERLKVADKELERLRHSVANTQSNDIAGNVVEVKGVKVLAEIMENADVKMLRETVDRLKDKLGSAVVVLGSIEDSKVKLIAGVTRDISGKIPAGDLVNMIAEQVGGRGGGRPDMAQAGGNNAAALPSALTSVVAWIESRLG